MPITGSTRGGRTWIPKFVESIDVEKCIGCGRCFKVCSRDVIELIDKPFEGEDEYGDDMGNKVMSLEHLENRIGCEACSSMCAKKCHLHVEL